VWKYGRLGLREWRLASVVRLASQGTIHQFKAQELGNTAWALARLLVLDAPLLAAISSASQRLLHVA